MADHVHSDELTTIALDDRAPSGFEDAHLQRCTACAEELSALRMVVRQGRAAGAADLGALEQPGEQLWRQIAVAVELPGGEEPGAASDGVVVGAPDDAPGGAVLPLGRRRTTSRVPGWMGLAAALVILAVAAGASVVALRGEQTELATVELAALTDDAAAGRARLLERQGHRELALDLPDEVTPEEVASDEVYLEVWLIDDAVEGMVSLGAVRPDEARVTVPDGLDLSAYPIVDVSREPFDGDPLHSGDSLWRGRLGTPS